MIRPTYPSVALLAGLLAAAAGAQTSLKDAAAKAGLNFGAAVSGNLVSGSNTTLQNILKQDFNMLVCENDMKFQNTEPSQGRFSYTAGDRVVAFAAANNMTMRGHTLVWHSQSGWAGNITGRAQLLKVMKDHIDNVAGHYKGKIREWDVVNEAVADGSTSLRNSFWRQQIGEDFIDSAFTWAHKADPDAQLFYNDYGAEGMNTKSTGVFNLVSRLKKNGVPIHGVGLQSHFGASINKADIDRNIKRLGELGLRVSITELDIVDASHSTKPWTDLMDVCVANANCVSFVTWGIYDGASWKASGGTCNCLVYDTQMKPKAIHAALVASMEKAEPAVVAARKTFGTGTSLARDRNLIRPLARRAALGAGPARLFIHGGSAADLTGRRIPVPATLLSR